MLGAQQIQIRILKIYELVAPAERAMAYGYAIRIWIPNTAHGIPTMGYRSLCTYPYLRFLVSKLGPMAAYGAKFSKYTARYY
eukprot:SAG31_NODE_1949_length_6833_cov_4.354024_1_plen_81_part_10